MHKYSCVISLSLKFTWVQKHHLKDIACWIRNISNHCHSHRCQTCSQQYTVQSLALTGLSRNNIPPFRFTNKCSCNQLSVPVHYKQSLTHCQSKIYFSEQAERCLIFKARQATTNLHQGETKLIAATSKLLVHLLITYTYFTFRSREIWGAKWSWMNQQRKSGSQVGGLRTTLCEQAKHSKLPPTPGTYSAGGGGGIL